MTEADKGASGAATPSSDVERAKQRLEEERRAAEGLAREAQGAMSGIGDRAKQAAVRQGEEVREEAVSHLRHFADAVRHAGDELSEKEPGVISDVVREAAYGLERFSESLSRKQPSEVFGAVRDFGRRHPGAFLAGSMLMGFALARFATTSAPRRHAERTAYGARGYEGGGTGYTGSYPGVGAGTGVGGSGVGGSGLGGTGAAGTGGAAGHGTGGSASADVARTGAAYPNSPGTSGMAYGTGAGSSYGTGTGTGPSGASSPGTGSSSPSGTSGATGGAGVAMGGPGQGPTGAPAGGPVKPSTSTDTKPGSKA